MTPYIAYLLGVITILIPIMIFFILSLNFNAVSNAWDNVFCSIS